MNRTQLEPRLTGRQRRALDGIGRRDVVVVLSPGELSALHAMADNSWAGGEWATDYLIGGLSGERGAAKRAIAKLTAAVAATFTA